MIFEVLEGPGSWGLELRPETPDAVRAATRVPANGFAQIVITETPVDVDAYSPAELRGVSIYGGMLRRQEGLKLSGPGLWAYLGDESGVGPLVAPALNADRTLYQWALNLDLAPFITASADLDDFISLDWTTDRWMTYREALEVISDLFGLAGAALWLQIDHRTMEIVSVPPVPSGPAPYLTPFWDGREGAYTLLRCRVEPIPYDLDEYQSQVTVIGGAGTDDVVSSTVLNDPEGNPIRMEAVIEDSQIPAGYEAATGTAHLTAHGTPEPGVVAYTDEHAVAAVLKPGSLVGVWSPGDEVYDLTHPEVYLHGEITWPLMAHVHSMRWPVRPNMGVAIIGENGVTNLSDWIVPEFGEAQLELGRPKTRVVRSLVRQGGTRRQV